MPMQTSACQAEERNLVICEKSRIILFVLTKCPCAAWESSAAMGEVFLWAGGRDDGQARHTPIRCRKEALPGRL